MVCSEMDWSIGPENHATTLMTFGCCEGAPIIMKQEQEPAGRTMQLSQLAGGGARRRLMSSGGMLGDKHSLSADYAQLLKDEKSMQKRVAKLAVSKMLPYRGQQLRVVRSRGGNDGELAGRARDNDRPHVDTPGEDDFGTERQYTSQEGRPDRTWRDHGRRCVGADCPRDDDEEFEDTLGSVTSRGTPARYNHPQQHRQHPAGSRGAMRRKPDAGLDTFENPAEEDPADMTPEEFAGWLEQTNAGYAGADLYVQYERCTRRRSKSQCLKQIERSIERWEYKQRRRAMRGRRGRGMLWGRRKARGDPTCRCHRRGRTVQALTTASTGHVQVRQSSCCLCRRYLTLVCAGALGGRRGISPYQSYRHRKVVLFHLHHLMCCLSPIFWDIETQKNIKILTTSYGIPS